MVPDQQSLDETELEKWREGLTECSFDKRDKVDPPTKELVGTLNERFLVTALEVHKGISMVRKYASVVELPTTWKVPDAFTGVFDRAKALYALMLSLHFTVKSMVEYTNNKFAGFEEELADIEDKIVKVMRFTDTIRTRLLEVHKNLGTPNVVFQPVREEAPRKPGPSLMREPRQKKQSVEPKKKWTPPTGEGKSFKDFLA